MRQISHRSNRLLISNAAMIAVAIAAAGALNAKLPGAHAATPTSAVWAGGTIGASWFNTAPYSFTTAPTASCSATTFTSTTSVLFNSQAGSTAATFTKIDGVSGTTLNIGSLTFKPGTVASAQTYYQGVSINAGNTLQLGYTGTGDGFLISDNYSGSGKIGSENVTLTGAGSLIANIGNSNFRVATDVTPSSNTLTQLDASGLSTLNVTCYGFYVGTSVTGTSLSQYASANVLLPTGAGSTTTINAVAMVIAGGLGTRNSNMSLGLANIINTDSISFGSSNAGNAIIQLGVAGSSLTLAGKSTPAAGADINIGTGYAGLQGSAYTTDARLDLSTNALAGGLNLTMHNLTLGAGTAGITTGYYHSTFNFAATTDTTSTLAITNVLNIGNGQGGSGNKSQAAVNLNGGVSTVASGINMNILSGGVSTLAVSNAAKLTVSGGINANSPGVANISFANTSSATIIGGVILSGVSGSATFTIGGTSQVLLNSGGITNGGGSAAVVVSGGTLNANGNNIGASGTPISSFTYSSGTVSNVANIYTGNFTGSSTAAATILNMGAGTLAISGAGAASAAGLALSINGGLLNMSGTGSADTFSLNAATISNASLMIDVIGTGSDKLAISGLTGSTFAGTNVVTVNASGLLPGLRPLISYTTAPTSGTSLSSVFSLSPSSTFVSGFTLSLQDNAGELDLIVSAGNAWTGGTSDWGSTPGNFGLGTIPNASGASAVFLSGAGTNSVNLSVPITVGNMLVDSSSPFTFSSSNGSTLTFQDPSGTATLVANTSAQTISAGITLASNTTFNISSRLTVSNISGPGILTKTGAGALILTAANTASPNVTLSAGTIKPLVSNALAASIVTLSGGTIDTTGLTSINLAGLAGGTSQDLRGVTWTLGNDVPTYASSNSVFTNSTGIASIIKNGANTQSLFGTVSGNVNVTVNAGKLELTPVNSFVGNFILNGGTLSINQSGSLGNAANTLTFAGNSTFLKYQAANVVTIPATMTIGINSGVSATFDPNGNNLITVAAPISGAGTLIKAGNGTLSLTAANTYAGGTSVNSGVVTFNSLSNFGSGAVTLNAASLQYATGYTGNTDLSSLSTHLVLNNVASTIDTNGNNVTFAADLSPAAPGGLVKAGAGTMVIAAAQTYNGGTSITGGTLQFNDGGSVIGNIATNASTNVTLNFSGNRVISNPITGAGSLTQNGPGTVTLATANTFTGLTTILNGVLKISDPNALQGSNLRLDSGLGTFDASGLNPVLLGNLSGNGALDLLGSHIQVGNNNQASTYSGALSDSSSGKVGVFEKIGTGLLALGNPANGEKNITVSLGTLSLLTNATLGAANALVTVAGGALDLGANTTSAGKLSLTGGIVQNGTFIASQDYDAQVGIVAATANLSGNVAFVKTGGGPVTLGGANGYSGGTTINSGTVRISGGASGWLGTGPVTFTGAGTLDLSPLANTVTGALTNNIIIAPGVTTATLNNLQRGTFSGSVTGGSDATLFVISNYVRSDISGNWTNFLGTVSISNAQTALDNGFSAPNATIVDNGIIIFSQSSAATLSLGGLTGTGTLGPGPTAGTTTHYQIGNNGQNTQFDGVVTDTPGANYNGGAAPGILSLTKQGTGTLTLTNTANAYSGGTTINGGALSISADSILGTSNAAITFGGGKLLATGSITSARALTFTGIGTIDTNGNDSTFAGAVTGAGLLTKLSAGNLTIAGLPTGGAAISGGKVSLIASGTNDVATRLSALSVSGGTLDISNQDLLVTVPGTITSGSIITSRTAAGVTVGVAAITGAQYLAFHGPTATFDGQTVNPTDLVLKSTYAGDATADGVINLDDYIQIDDGYLLHATGWVNGDFNGDGTVTALDYALIDASYAHQSGTLADGEIALHTAEFGSVYTDALSALTTSAVPEPASMVLLGLGATGLLARRRRR